VLEFGVSGKLINNALVMFDRDTRSLWSQFLSIGIAGEFEGRHLETVPLTLTTWERWSEIHPDTVALRKPNSNSRDAYASYYGSRQAGVIGEKVKDSRLPLKELVLGVGFDDGPKAFPHSQLRTARVVNDQVAGQDAVVFYETRSATALVFNRVVDGRTLTFRLAEEDGREWLIDEETGTRWMPFTGQAVDGPLAGKVLDRLHAVNVFWFAWTDFYPETEVFGIS